MIIMRRRNLHVEFPARQKETEEVDHEHGRRKVGGEERFVIVQILKNILCQGERGAWRAQKQAPEFAQKISEQIRMNFKINCALLSMLYTNDTFEAKHLWMHKLPRRHLRDRIPELILMSQPR
jgi:hypothetical protein